MYTIQAVQEELKKSTTTSKKEAKPMEFDAIKEQLKGSLLQEKQQEAYKSKINQLQILFPVDRF